MKFKNTDGLCSHNGVLHLLQLHNKLNIRVKQKFLIFPGVLSNSVSFPGSPFSIVCGHPVLSTIQVKYA